MLCPNCGSENRDAAKFCDECGFPLSGAIARVAASLQASGPFDANPETEPDEVEEQSDDAQAVEHVQDAAEGEGDGEEQEKELSDGSEEEDAGAASEVLPEASSDEDCEAGFNDPDTDGAVDDMANESLDERKRGSEERELDDITAMIPPQGGSAGDDDLEEDVFAGFTKHADDGYSFEPREDYLQDGIRQFSSQEAGFTMKMPRVQGEPKEQNRDFVASSTVPKKSHGKLIAVIAVLVALAAAIAIGTFALGLWGGKSVPDVTNMTETDARAVLEEGGFTVRATQVKSDDTEGLVLIMDPAAGSRVAEGSEVVIHVATARLVPDVKGKTSEEAAAILADAGYDTVAYEKVKHDGDENIVLEQTPEAGERAKSSNEIKLGVSEAYRVPDIKGMTWDEAFAAIKDAGLLGDVAYISTEYYPEGSIIGTTPEAGAVVTGGSYVVVNIAQSRATVLTSLTQNMLVPGSTVTVGGYNYTIDALGSVSYLGNDTVAFSFTGRPFVSLFGETIHASAQTVNGQVVWSPSNEVVSIT